jgi:hypothetical protein
MQLPSVAAEQGPRAEGSTRTALCDSWLPGWNVGAESVGKRFSAATTQCICSHLRVRCGKPQHQRVASACVVQPPSTYQLWKLGG